MLPLVLHSKAKHIEIKTSFHWRLCSKRLCSFKNLYLHTINEAYLNKTS